MRTALATLLALSAVLPLPARPDEPRRVELMVGQELRLGGSVPICDDPSVAWISADGAGVLHAVKAGTTLCSVTRGRDVGARQVYRVVVIGLPAAPPPSKAPEKAPPAPTKDPSER